MRLQAYLTVVCLFLFGGAALFAQTQYIGPAGGDWFTAVNWNNGLPANGNDPLIGGGASVNIGAPLTIDFTIVNFGTIISDADITNDGTISNSGTFDVTASGSLTNNATFNNFNTSTFAGPATFVNETGASFTNGGTFTLNTTLVNRGGVTNNGTIDAAAGTLVTEGNFDNAQTLTTESLTVQPGSTFTNNFGANLNITGAAAELLVDGSFNNLGTVTAAGMFTVNGTFANSSSVTTSGILTINSGGVFNNASGTVNTQSGTQNFGTFINGFQLINTGAFNNFGQFNNNNLIDNEVGGTFTNRPGSTLSMGFGSRVENDGTFSNESAFDSFGTIENNGSFSNTGNINSFSGSLIDNNSGFTNDGTISTNDQVLLDGAFTNNGTINVNGGSIWRNASNFTNGISGTVNVQQDFVNEAAGTVTNNGRWTNFVRTRNEGNFVNNALFEILAENLTNTAGATFTNNELLLLRSGNLLNEGTLTNNDLVQSDECSTINNSGTINNPGNFILMGLLFQTGTLTGNAIDCQGCYVHTSANSNAPSVCQNGTFGADIDGEVKVYAPELIAFANFDSCANIVYLADGVDRPVYFCSDIGSVITVDVVLRTRLNDSLTCTAEITPVDVLEPQFDACPRDIVIFTPNTSETATWTEPTATDNCTATTLTNTHSPGDNFPVGITGVTYTATDDYGNENNCQFRVDVRQTGAGGSCAGDTEGPTFPDCPGDITVSTSNQSIAVGWTPPTPVDDCYPITLNSDFAPGQSFGIGLTTVVYTATDGNGNENTCEFRVTVGFDDPCLVDNVPPSFVNCPANIYQLTNPTTGGAVAVWNEPGIFDLCGLASVTATHASGEVFAEGTTNVTYTATDNSGNVSTCNFIVTVGANPCPGVSNPPVFQNCPNDVNVTTTGNSGVGVWTAPTATSSCNPVTINSNYSPGATFQLGVTQVIYTASDLVGNTSTCTFLVIVQNDCQTDAVPPVISNCPADITVAANGGSGTATWTPPTASDNCQLTTFTSTFQPGASFPVGTTTVIYTASDLNGNIATCEFNVTVVEAPGCTQNASPIEGTTNVDPASVDLSWITQNEASSYNVFLGTSNPPTTQVASNVMGTSTTVTGLQGNTTYYWYVVPVNASGSAMGCESTATSFSTSDGGGGGDCNFDALFVVGNTSLNAGDAFVKARLESLGFNVTTVDDDLSATSDADGKGLIMISSTVQSGKVNTKYRDVAVPLINYEAYLYDDLKMTNTGGGTNYGNQSGVSQMVIENAGHPLAAGLSGTQTVFTSSQQVTWGKPAASATVIGGISGNTSRKMVFAYDTGDQMISSQIAPAPRVGFFLRNSTADNLNANGLALFDAAVQWATGTGTPGDPCDDGDPSTSNDVILADGCTCEGTPVCDGAVTGFLFFDLNSGNHVTLQNGGSYALNALPASYNIQALVSGTSESANFQLTGPVNIDHTENYIPYHLNGDPNPIYLTPGNYTLTVTLYSEDNMGGSVCSQTTITFTIENDDPCAGNGPVATASATNATCGQGNGSITFSFPDNPTQTGIEFSIDGGNSYPYWSPDDAGSMIVGNLAPGTYDIWVRWGNNDCPTDLGNITVGDDVAAPNAVCQNITLQLSAPGQSVQISGSDVDGGSTAGCGTIASLNVSPNSFDQPGTYTVTLTVTNSFGLSANCNATVTVNLNTQPEDCSNGVDDDGDGLVDCDDPDCASSTGSISVRINDDDDDAEERISDGDMDRGSSDLELTEEGSTPQIVGMRFTNIQIPQGATITNAYIEFETDETDDDPTNLTFSGQDIDDAPTFSNNDYDISSRTKTSASVDWNNVPEWNSTNEKHQTPDLSSIVEEIVGRGGWNSGNDLVIIVEGSGERTAESYDGESDAAPLLVVEFAECGNNCDNVTNGGSIGKNCQGGQVAFNNLALPSGGSGAIEYLWIWGTTDCNPDNMSQIPGSGSTPNLTIPGVSQTTYVIRCARRAGCTDWDGESNCLTVNPGECSGGGCPDNLLVNPGFEYGTSGWTWVSNAGTSSSQAYTGSAALEVCNGQGGVAQYLPGLAGNTYTLEAYAKVNSSSVWSGIGLKFFDTNWNLISEHWEQVTTTNYSLISISQTAPSGTAIVEVGVWNNTGGCLYADDFCLLNETTSTACGENLLANENPGFESNFDQWDWVDNVVIFTSGAYAGAKSAEVCNAQGGAGNSANAVPGKVYTLNAAGRISGSPSWAAVGLSFFDSNWNQVGNYHDHEVTTTVWSNHVVQATAPANAAYVSAYFWKNSGGCLQVDEFCLSESNGSGGGCNTEVLFVVGNTSLNSGDTWVNARLASLGFNVELVDDDQVQTEDGNGKGLVIISSTTSSGKVGNKFTNSPVPVLTWEPWLLDNLKMTGPYSGSDYGNISNQTHLNISDSSHPLAAGLSGNVQVFTYNSSMNWGWVPYDDFVQKVAYVGNTGNLGILAYDTDDLLYDNTPPAARRVSLWLNNTSATLLNANGVVLFDAAVNWAASCGEYFGEGIEDRSSSLNLMATKNGFDTELVWQSNSAELDELFTIERSADGENWEPILTIDNKESDRESVTYHAFDEEPLAGQNFYRVIGQRSDGSVKTSGMAEVFFLDLADYTVFPNPARDHIYVDMGRMAGMEVLVRLFDAKGVVVGQWEVTATEEPMRFELDQKQSGQYMLWLYTDDRRPVTRRLILERN